MVDPLVVAGEAAAILEQHGLVACARRKNGVVTVDSWIRRGNETLEFSHVVGEREADAQRLAERCLAELPDSMGEMLVQRHHLVGRA